MHEVEHLENLNVELSASQKITPVLQLKKVIKNITKHAKSAAIAILQMLFTS